MKELTSTVRISGRPITDYVIVTASSPTSTETYSAENLKKYLDLALDADFAVINDTQPKGEYEILVGVTNRRPRNPELQSEEIEICATTGQLSICGGDDRGTFYAVLAFLESYIGWRWFGADTEVLRPQAAREIFAGEVVRRKPFFEYRNAMFFDATRNSEFKTKISMNTSISEDIKAKTGGSVDYSGFVHTFTYLLPEKEYFETHPEYYALRDGVRKPTQPCLSNPDVLEIVTKNALETLRKNKQAFISISQNDNQAYCQCEKCRAIDEEEGSPSGILLRFVNKVAEAIEKEFPDVLVDTLAYQYTRALPKITRPRHNVMIRLCSIECCFRHPLYDEQCEANQRFCKDINDWSSICDRIYVWDYCTNFCHYSMAQPNYNILRENIKYYAQHNVVGMLSQGNYNGKGADLNEFKSYILSKLYWNPFMSDAEYEYHITDFLEGFYGKGWQYIRKYMDILLEETADKHFGCFCSAAGNYERVYDRMDEILELFDKAYELAEGIQKDHVKLARLSAINIKLQILNTKEFAEGSPEKADRIAQKVAYYNECKSFGLRPMEWRPFSDDNEENLVNGCL